MPIDTIYDKANNTMIRTVTGRLDVDEVVITVEHSMQETSFRKGMHVIWDLTGADVAGTGQDEMLEIIDYLNKTSDKRGEAFKLAIVAPTDLAFGLSRMFETYGNQLPLSISVFRSMKQARHWVAQNGSD